MADNYCGRQHFQRVGWVAPAYHEKEGATPHPGMHKHSLQYDGRLIGALGCGLGRGI